MGFQPLITNRSHILLFIYKMLRRMILKILDPFLTCPLALILLVTERK